ncbi:hypothetical protein [Rhabdothermincola sediminis]|uniref:hypothetical protein n=1 Tax=Rhabdothermincola sediminis TaxID=2751370 RepID=UPI001AA04305|nr:hypothetical protein [Rhabdothermincola sediminis]
MTRPARSDFARLASLADRVRPVVLAREQTLPVLPALAGLLPDGALPRGTVVSVGGEAATTLALSLAAGPSAAGSWVAGVGLPALGLAAAAETGMALERLVLVAEPPRASWGSVMAALVDGFDVILLGTARRVRAAEARRLIARSRERGSVLVILGTGPEGALETDLRLRSGSVRWEGLGRGHGHLRARRVTVEASGRRRAARPRRLTLWLPGPDGAIAVMDHPIAAPAAAPRSLARSEAG